jgi:hypothetical protein
VSPVRYEVGFYIPEDGILQIIGGWEKRHNEERRNLHSSPNEISMSRSTRMRCDGHVARM